MKARTPQQSPDGMVSQWDVFIEIELHWTGLDVTPAFPAHDAAINGYHDTPDRGP